MAPLKAEVVNAKEFEWSYTEEPHATRRSTLLSTRPVVQSLLPFSDTVFKWKAILGVSVQVLMAFLVTDMPWWAVLSLAYLIGGTINHAMTLALHETSHNSAFGPLRPQVNRAFGIFVNLPLGIPAFASFQRYHKDHHTHQGEEVLDTDVPTAREGQIFVSTGAKIFWVLIQPLFYAFRPLITAPKKPGVWEAANAITQIAFDAVIVYFWGVKPLAYLILGTLLGMGIHPMAGHFIAEHYTFIKGQEVGCDYAMRAMGSQVALALRTPLSGLNSHCLSPSPPRIPDLLLLWTLKLALIQRRVPQRTP